MTVEIEEKKEIIDTTKIDGEIDDIIIQDDKLFVIEEVSDEKDTKSDKDKDLTPEEIVDKKASKSDDGSSDTEKFEITEPMRVRMLEKKIAKMDTQLADSNLSPDAIRQRIPLADLQTDIKRQRSILADIDKDTNPDEWRKQNGIVTTLAGDIADKKSDAELEKRYKSKDNVDFLKTERKSLAKKGFVFSDAQFDGIAAAAEVYLDGGMFTVEGMRKGLIDIIGADATDKLYQAGSEQKIRKEIKDAAMKVTKSVRVTRTGVSAKLTSLTNRLMKIKDGDVLKTELRKLSDVQFAMYKKERDLIRKSKK